MAEEKKEIPDRGKTLLSWDFSEYDIPNRGKLWYVSTLLISAAILVWSIFTGNYLFTLVIILVGIIFVFQNRKKPKILECRIKEDGIETGTSFYDYNDIKKFWIVYRPPETKVLYIDFKSSLKPTLPISLEKQNPLEVRKVLKKYIEEDLEKEEEPASDQISRSLKI
ncbi:MAG: hypothetical protein U5L76_00115 [Patescibacteria group bacterium]|nr:hypothetical protein [Patescibacteria group bacterium]MDZ7798006.1 hypothetical protein [Patescibacteria group bacterium]